MQTTKIEVRYRVEGWHHWPNAPTSRYYLASSHRHLFHVTASVDVTGHDREIEFHDFLDFCKGVFSGGQRGAQSCEMMAKELLDKITARYGNRAASVSIFEDGEVGAVVTFYPV